jgi:protein-tyrosine phosphatase
VIDIHFHLLPGIDDGPAHLGGSVELARAASEAGTGTIVATPHVSPEYPNRPEAIERLAGRVAARLEQADVPVEVYAAGELAAGAVGELTGAQLRSLTLGAGRWLLLECPFARGADDFEAVARRLQGRGFDVLLAHPERSAPFQREPERIAALVEDGMLCSVTAGSLVGRFGDAARTAALALVEAGLVHNVASDAHNTTRRPPGAREQIAAAGLGSIAEWLTVEVPRALLDGASVPPRPS